VEGVEGEREVRVPGFRRGTDLSASPRGGAAPWPACVSQGQDADLRPSSCLSPAASPPLDSILPMAKRRRWRERGEGWRRGIADRVAMTDSCDTPFLHPCAHTQVHGFLPRQA